MAQPLSGWPVSVWLWVQVPAGGQESVAKRLTALAETRACFAVTGGRAGLVYGAWLRSLAHARWLERELAARVRNLTIVDRAVVLRFVKRVGHVLDDSGRSVEIVPADIWAEPVQ